MQLPNIADIYLRYTVILERPEWMQQLWTRVEVERSYFIASVDRKGDYDYKYVLAAAKSQAYETDCQFLAKHNRGPECNKLAKDDYKIIAVIRGRVDILQLGESI